MAIEKTREYQGLYHVLHGLISPMNQKGPDDRSSCNHTQEKPPEITVEDLIGYGMRAELAGRINRIVCLDPLTAKDMARIGQAETERLSEVLQRPVKISPDALLMIGRMAQQKGLGARWVKSRIGQIIDEMIYEDPTAPEYVVEYEPADADERRQAECCAPIQSEEPAEGTAEEIDHLGDAFRR